VKPHCLFFCQRTLLACPPGTPFLPPSSLLLRIYDACGVCAASFARCSSPAFAQQLSLLTASTPPTAAKATTTATAAVSMDEYFLPALLHAYDVDCLHVPCLGRLPARPLLSSLTTQPRTANRCRFHSHCWALPSMKILSGHRYALDGPRTVSGRAVGFTSRSRKLVARVRE
jgi:hypothetical protein